VTLHLPKRKPSQGNVRDIEREIPQRGVPVMAWLRQEIAVVERSYRSRGKIISKVREYFCLNRPVGKKQGEEMTFM